MAKSDLGRPSPFSMKSARSASPSTYPAVLRVEVDTKDIQARLTVMQADIDSIEASLASVHTKLDTIITNTTP